MIFNFNGDAGFWNKGQVNDALGTKHWSERSYIVPILDLFYFT